jgi:hypothetical protein
LIDELVDRMAISVVVRRFPGMVAAVSRSLRSKSMSACNILFVDLIMFPFDVFGGMCGENSCNVFLPFFMVPWVPIFATLCKRALLMLWHAFLFIELTHVGFFPSLLPFAWWFSLPIILVKKIVREYGIYYITYIQR